MAQVYEKVISVISKPPAKRTQKEIESLIPWILKKSDLMQKLKTDVVIDIIRNCAFVTKQNDDVIIKQGELGDCFYIILTGIVSIYISNALADEENLTGSVEQQQQEKDAAAKAEEIGPDGQPKEKKKLDRSKFGNYIAKIPAGKSFGELALISKDCVRNASIIADEQTDLLVVNRDLYNRSLKAAQLAEFEEKSSFVAENPLFSNWQAKFKRQMAMSVVKTRIPYDSYIVRQGDPVVGLFFVMSGQAKVIVDPSYHEVQYPQHLPLGDDMAIDLNDDHLDDGMLQVQPRKKRQDRDRSPGTRSLPPDQKHNSTNQPHSRTNQRKMKEICLIGARDVIGDIEMSTELSTYYASVKCIEDTDVFTLDMKNYERLVTRKNPWSVQAMKDSVGTKLHSRIQRLDRSVPILNALLRKLDEAILVKQKQLEAQQAPHIAREKQTLQQDFDDFIPQRGPLVDLFGPGTVFFRNRQREKAKKIKNKSRAFGATGANNFPAWGLLGLKGPAGGVNEQKGASIEALNNESGLPQIVQMVTLLTDEKDAKLPARSAFLTEPANGTAKSDDSEPDYETSEQKLSTLESRIREWHTLVDKIGPSIVVTVDAMTEIPAPILRYQMPVEKRVTQLSRYKKDEQKKLAPGKKVYVRRRKKDRHRSFLSDALDNIIDHKHSKRRTASDGQSDTERESDDEQKLGPSKSSTSLHARKQHMLMLRKEKQYTVEEYAELKQKLRERSRDLQKFLTSLETY